MKHIKEIAADYAVAALIGIGIGLALVQWWSS